MYCVVLFLCAAPSDSLEQHFVQLIRGCSGEEEWRSHHSTVCAGKCPQHEPETEQCDQITVGLVNFPPRFSESESSLYSGLKRFSILICLNV